MKKHTYFSNRNGYLEHRYDCNQCKKEQFINTAKFNLAWFMAIVFVTLIITYGGSLWNFL